VETEYAAFLKAVRELPMQQREAFLLHHGEQLPQRKLAVAMDLSVQAASQHLSSAEAVLKPIGSSRYEEFLNELKTRYHALTPNATITVPRLKRFIARRIWPRRIKRALLCLLVLGAFAGIGYALWKLRPLIEW
jgi:hypothetical protein